MKKHYLSIKTAQISIYIIVCFIILDVPLQSLREARAHPHVFIVQRLNVVFDEKGIAGIKVHWKFDDMFASMVAEDHDQNKNGKLEPAEVKTVRQNAFSYIFEYNYFTFIKIENKPFKVKFITDFNAVLEDKKLVYEFFIPCHVTAISTPKNISVATYDPTYYTAIYFDDETPVSLTSAESYDVKTDIREDSDTKIYYDLVHPWTLFINFRKKS